MLVDLFSEINRRNNMSKQTHQWATFYSPRNGRISIQACAHCGIAKGMVYEAYKCEREKMMVRLQGWTTEKPVLQHSGVFIREMRLIA